jgi:hypothetical protein
VTTEAPAADIRAQGRPIWQSVLVFLVVAVMPTMVVPLVIRRSVGRTIVAPAIVVPAVASRPVVIVNGLILIIPCRTVATPVVSRPQRHLEAKILSL